MRSNSNKLDDESDKKKTQKAIKMCKAKTKSGKDCSNKAVEGSIYCGIVSHRKLDPNYEDILKKKSSSKRFLKLKNQFVKKL